MIIVNIPVLFYSSCLYAIITNQEFHHPYHDILSSKLMSTLCALPLVAAIITWFASLPRQLKLSNIYDSNGDVISTSLAASRKHMPFLPDPDFTTKEKYDAIRNLLIDLSRQNKKAEADGDKKNKNKKKSWALVTGASRGIGRALAISLARRNIPCILVARDADRLQKLSNLIQECYGVPTMVIICDISKDEDIHQMMQTLEQKKIKEDVHVDILVNNAGLGGTDEIVDMPSDKMDQMQQVNIRGTSKLVQLFGKDMKLRRTGRIVFVASITGAVPGVPTSAMYAATKSYQRSLSNALGRELESYGVGVTCSMPGAVGETNFQKDANMSDSTIFNLPSVLAGAITLKPELVAETTVRAMIRGQGETFVGWFYVLVGRLFVFLLPPRLEIFMCEFFWRPLPFTSGIRNVRDKAKVS